MITNFLLDNAALVPVALLLIALACASTGYLLLRAGLRRILWTLAALSVLPVIALTLTPPTTRVDGVICTFQFAVPTLGTVELLANVALFFPLVYFTTLATRRLLLTLATGMALSAAAEAVQALVPAIGRACDTNDWAMNTIGTIAAALLASATIAIATRRPTKPHPGA
jgi:VanZ family protein